jgi:phosphoenolpyruvate carboxylase
VISQRYSHPELALRSLEQTVSGVLLATLGGERGDVPDSFRVEALRLAERSRQAYTDLVRHERFFEFMRRVTPLDELADLNIGSRPAARYGQRDLESLRAIPWVFAWMQNRLLLPAWFGAGTALGEGDLDLHRAMRNEWPFFAMLCSTLEMALFKADMGVAERYLVLSSGDGAGEIWERVRTEHELVVARVLEITGNDRLLADPLSHLQVDLLRRFRDGDAEAKGPLLQTVSGIAAGMRNTG